jgi:hypothetical protein
MSTDEELMSNPVIHRLCEFAMTTDKRSFPFYITWLSYNILSVEIRFYKKFIEIVKSISKKDFIDTIVIIVDNFDVKHPNAMNQLIILRDLCEMYDKYTLEDYSQLIRKLSEPLHKMDPDELYLYLKVGYKNLSQTIIKGETNVYNLYEQLNTWYLESSGLFTQKQDERLERKRAITRSLYRSYYPKDYFEKYIQAFPEFKIAPREEQAKVIEAFKKELIRAVNLKDEDRKILNDLLAQYVKANNHKANSTNNKSNQKANSKSNQKVQRRR